MALRKNRTRFTVGLAVGIMMVVGLLGPIAPALAGHGAGTANVDIHEILAGTPSQAFRITVTHPAGDTQNLPDSITNPQPAPPAVNWVQVTTPPGFQASATSTSGPHSGWSVSVLPLGSEAGRRVIFSLTSGNGIAASGSGVFTINSAVPRPAAEVTGPTANWQVRSSSDGGESFVLPTGDLSTRVRVLKIDDVALTSPAGVVDHSVTGNQGKRRDVDSDGTPDEADVLATCVVTNHASVAHVITPTLGGGSNVNIEEGAGQAATVASRAQHTFTYRVSFADVSTTQSPALQCNANSVRADGGAGIGTTPTGFNLQKTITIQPKAVFTYNSVPQLPSFSPNALSPNSDNVTFRVAIQKSGVPAVALDPARTTLAFKNNAGEVKIPPIRLSSTPAVPAGNVSNFVLEFGPVNLASLGLTDGRLTGELNIRGMDANDAVVAFLPVPSFAEKLLIDAGIPTLDLNITPPNLPTGWPTDPDFNLVVRAARNGQTVSFGGKVEDTNPDTTQQEGCGTCTILSSHLVPYSQENGGEAGTPIPVTLNINPSTGAITGSYTLAAGAIGSAKSLVLRAQVRDAAGNVSALTTSVGCPWCNPTWSTEVRDQLSGRSIIDNTTPLIVSAKTRRRATGEQNLLEVTLSECVNGTTTARDWTLSGSTNRVVAVENAAGRPSCKVSSQVPYSSSATVLLRTANEFPDDSTAGNDLPSLSYDPGATVPHPLDPTTSVSYTHLTLPTKRIV